MTVNGKKEADQDQPEELRVFGHDGVSLF
jgi:hypothetical protein